MCVCVCDRVLVPCSRIKGDKSLLWSDRLNVSMALGNLHLFLCYWLHNHPGGIPYWAIMRSGGFMEILLILWKHYHLGTCSNMYHQNMSVLFGVAWRYELLLAQSHPPNPSKSVHFKTNILILRIHALVVNSIFVLNKENPSHPILQKTWKWIMKDVVCYPSGACESLENDWDSSALCQELEPNLR